jgi:pSer/pThr/pTyr-binding forkhead associated (FHA) protein
MARQGRSVEVKSPLITMGQHEGNDFRLPDGNVSQRHCAIVSYLDDVWIYDLASAQGVFLDGMKIDGKAYLEGLHVLKLGQTEFTLCSKLGLLV